MCHTKPPESLKVAISCAANHLTPLGVPHDWRARNPGETFPALGKDSDVVVHAQAVAGTRAAARLGREVVLGDEEHSLALAGLFAAVFGEITSQPPLKM